VSFPGDVMNEVLRDDGAGLMPIRGASGPCGCLCLARRGRLIAPAASPAHDARLRARGSARERSTETGGCPKSGRLLLDICPTVM
jgi:hypothetical protein